MNIFQSSLTTRYTSKMDTSALTLLALISTVPLVSYACDFPDFLQSRRDGPTREWHVQHLEYHRGREHRYTHVITIMANIMKAEIDGDEHNEHGHHKAKSYERRCVLEIEPGQFLVTHNEEEGSMQKYMCIEFIKRSDSVAQIRQSKLSEIQDPRLCRNDGMTLNNWPLINKADLYSTYQPCPLQGGYFARFYDKTKRMGYCDVYEGETMVESECMKEEGMYFRFRYDKCIPDDLHMKADQQLFCMANWEQDEQMFLILRHATEDHQWCFRYPKKNPNKFIGALYKDLVCDPAPVATEEITNDFLSVTLVRAPPQSVRELCRDDYEGCSYWTEPCKTPGSPSHMTCAKKCNICNGTMPSTCTLPHNFWGPWLESNKYGQKIVDIQDRLISKHEYETFQCINWEEKAQPDTAEHMEQMFVTTFDNGCKPRYTCAEFKMHSPASSVLHYKLSLSKVWPFYNADWNNIDCSSFHYRDAPSPVGDAYHSRHMKVLISMDSITNVNCGLEHPLDFTITVENDITCHGMLTVKDSSVYKNKRLEMLLYDCPNRKPTQEFTCLDSHRHGYIRRQTIITMSAEDTNQYQCWYFPVSPQHTFYHLPMKHCNEGAAAQILAGTITPLGTFNVQYTTTTSTTTLQPPPRIIVDKVIGLNENNQKRNPDDRKQQNNHNSILVRTNDGSIGEQSKPDSYSHLSEDGQPQGEMLVSPDSELDKRNKESDDILSEDNNDKDRARPTGNGAARLSSTSLATILMSIVFFLSLH